MNGETSTARQPLIERRELWSAVGVVSDDCFEFARQQLQLRCRRKLYWFQRAPRERAARWHRGLFIATGSSGRPFTLDFQWSHGGRRRLGRGSLKEMERLAAEHVAVGGPFGGATSFRGVKHARAIRAAIRRLGDGPGEWVRLSRRGNGFQFHLRCFPGEKSALFLVSPRGSFMYCGPCDTPAVLNHIRFEDGRELDFDNEAIAIRVRGALVPLRYAQVPGILGVAEFDGATAYLVLLGPQMSALVVSEGDLRRTIAEGRPDMLKELEVAYDSGRTPRLGRSARRRPPSWSSLPDALQSMGSLHESVRVHLIDVVRTIPTRVSGALTLKRLIWALVLQHQDGREANLGCSSAELFRNLVEFGYLDDYPAGKARASAMRLFESLSPLVTRRPRAHRWTVNFSDFKRPSGEMRYAMWKSEQRNRNRRTGAQHVSGEPLDDQPRQTRSDAGTSAPP